MSDFKMAAGVTGNISHLNRKLLKCFKNELFEIVCIRSQAFFSLSFLEKLDLSWNRLTTLSVDFSAGLSALKELHLEHNNLHLISGNR